MAFSAKNQTNPLVIAVTGYAPYIKLRAERSAQASKGSLNKADRAALAIQSYWQRENVYQDIEDYRSRHQKDLLRNQWECAADRKALYSRVRWEVDKVKAGLDRDLERRRNRLSELLRAEEQEYLSAAIPEQEDPKARMERMEARYEALLHKKEQERKKVVEEKKEQQFKRNCDELRSRLSSKLQHETAADARRLAEERRRQAADQDREEAMYAELWVRDAEAKAQREERAARTKKEREEEVRRFVTEQGSSTRKLEQLRERREREEDAEVMAAERRLLDLEDEWRREMKRRRQQDLKQGLDECLRTKLKQRAKEVQDDLLQDLFFLQQVVEDREEEERSDKKKALMDEQQKYLRYLREQVQRETEFEQQVDRMYAEELERVWQQREQQWKLEKERRREKEQDVLRGLEEQMIANVERSRQMLAMNMLYDQKVVEEDAKEREKASETLRLIRERNAQHQRGLLAQMEVKREKVEREQLLRDRELEALRKGREEEEAKIQELLREMKIDKEHPYRVVRREVFDDCKECGTYETS